MAAATDVQVSHFLDEYGVGPFHIKLIIWSTVIAFIDGYDIGAIAFAAPSLIKEWHVAPKDLGVVLSASNFGVLFGSQIFGWIGDRYGRKTALILANLLFGVLTFAAAYSTNLTELSWLRSPSSRPAWCRSAVHSPASPARRWCRRTAGRCSSTSAASHRSCSRSPRFSACRNRSSS